jgi:hypothetical protein
MSGFARSRQTQSLITARNPQVKQSGLGIELPGRLTQARSHSPLRRAIRNLSSARRGVPRHAQPEHEHEKGCKAAVLLGRRHRRYLARQRLHIIISAVKGTVIFGITAKESRPASVELMS